MRIIAGKFSSRRLRSVAGLGVRPTSDRLRETLFNILRLRVEGSRFLDICAGSGAVGLEAISRGAKEITFIERSRRACSVIQTNTDALGVTQHVTLINKDAESAIKQLIGVDKQFDLVFFDPPYSSDMYDRILGLLGESDLLSKDAMIVVEHRTKQPPDDQYGKLHKLRTVKHGESALLFYELQTA